MLRQEDREFEANLSYVHNEVYFKIQKMKYWDVMQHRTLKTWWETQESSHKDHILYDPIYVKYLKQASLCVYVPMSVYL